MGIVEKLQDPKFWIERSLNDLFFLSRCVVSTLEDPSPGFKDLYKPTHKRVCDFISKYAHPGQKLIILMPRGWIKSYLITVSWTIQRILNNLVAGKRDHWLISNATLPNAKEFLKKVKFNFQYNDFLRGLFRKYLPSNPDTDAERWTLEDIEIKGNSVEIGSVEGNLVSRHYRGMINDDLVNWENSRTVDQIMKVIDWWKLAQSLLEADGLEIILGTRWSFNDLYGYIMREFLKIPKEREDEFRNLPVVEWHNGRYHYLRYLCWEDPVNEKGSTFPNLFPERRLKEIQQEQAEHFPGQYLNDPMSLQDAIFKRDWFVRRWRADQLPAVRLTYQLVDPAGKETRVADFTGQVVVDAGSDKQLYVRSAQRRKLTDLKAVEWMIETAWIHQPHVIGVEEFKFDTFRDLADFLIPQLIKQGKVPEKLVEFIKRIPYRMIMLRHQNRPKILRISNLTGWCEQGKVLLAPTGMDDLIEELIRLGKWDRDDIADAFAYILDVVMFPQTTDPPRLFVLSEEEKMTASEREKRAWEQAVEAAYIDQRPMVDDPESLY